MVRESLGNEHLIRDLTHERGVKKALDWEQQVQSLQYWCSRKPGREVGNEVIYLARVQRPNNDLVVLAFTQSEMGLHWEILRRVTLILIDRITLLC